MRDRIPGANFCPHVPDERELMKNPAEVNINRGLAFVDYLPIGQPNTEGTRIGPGFQLRTQEEMSNVMRVAGKSTGPFTIRNAAFCIDERPIVQLGNITDPDILRNIVAPRLPGGTYLASAKAVLAANAVIVRDAKTFDEVYDRVGKVLSDAGYEDAGHAICGAEIEAATSVKNQVAVEIAFAALRAIGVARDGEEGMVQLLHNNKWKRLDSGLWATYDPDARRDRVLRNASHNYAQLQTAHDKVHGHHGSGLYVTHGDQGLSNGFAQSGYMLFVYTHGFAKELANVLGGSPEERRLIELAFADDLIDVGNVLYAEPEGTPGDPNYYPGMAVFKQAFDQAKV